MISFEHQSWKEYSERIPIYLMGINVQSLKAHHDQLIAELESYKNKPTIIAITETWLSKNANLKVIGIPEYQPVLSKPRKTKKPRGGVAFYISESVEFEPIEFETEIESAIIRVKFGPGIYRIFCVIYRPQSHKMKQFLLELENLLNFLRSLKDDSMIFGDFNIDTIVESKETKDYENLLTAFDYRKQNNLPTRVTPTSATCLDHVITSFSVSTETVNTSFSDHYTVLGEIAVNFEKPEETITHKFHRDLRNIKKEKALNFLFLLDQKLKNVKKEGVLDLNRIALTIMECVDKFAPETVCNDKSNGTEWISNKIKNAIIERNKKLQKWIDNPTDENRSAYKLARNKVTSKIRKAKRDLNFEKLGNNPSTRTIFRTLKGHIREGQPKPVSLDSELLNEYFTSIGSILSSEITESDQKMQNVYFEKTFVLEPIALDEISKIIKSMKNKKSTGHDGINNEILKCCSPVIEPYLVEAFNDSIQCGIFPDCLKVAKVIALYKKGDRTNPENYRPISLLPSLSKVFEKILLKRMTKFCNKYQILSKNQYGFRQKYSCTYAIAHITELMRQAIDKKSTGQACFLDLKKAFDSLDHSILLKKIYNSGFRGPIFELLQNYLKSRFQYVENNGQTSNLLEIKTGVPQGSVLGPFLFLLYINDLPGICGKNANIALFADDTSLIKSGKRDATDMNSELERVGHWFRQNKLTLNITKCESMNFAAGKARDIEIFNSKLPNNNCFKYLGVYIDNKLTFREHIAYLTKKLNKFCGLVYKVRHLYPIKCLLLFYNAYARSLISYGLLVYGSAAKTNLEMLESAQRRIIRAIFFKQKRHSLKDIIDAYHIHTVFDLYILEVFKEVFKQIRVESPLCFLQVEKEQTSVRTRESEKGLFTTVYCRTVTKRKSIENTLKKAYNWLKEHNLIPIDIAKLTKAQIDTHLKKIDCLYVFDGLELRKLFFEKPIT